MISIFKFELKRNINKTSITLLIIFVMIGLIIHALSIERHKSDIEKQSDFVEIENKMTSQFQNYTQYGKDGFKILGSPDNINTLNQSSSTFGDLIGAVNSGIKLDLNKPQIGINVFEKPTGEVLDFSWYLITIGSMIALAYGWFSFRNQEFLKQLMASASSKPAIVHLGILAARTLLLIVSLTLIVLIIGIQMAITGLLTKEVFTELLSFFIAAIVCMTSFFIVSAIMGTMRSKIIGVSLTVFLWFVLLFLWPKVLNSVFLKTAASNIKSKFNYELQKMDIKMNFQKEFSENIKSYKTISERMQASKEMSEHYFNNEFRKIEKLDLQMIDTTENLVEKVHFWSILNPVTFYRSVNNELSGRGYVSYLSFYRYIQRKQKEFLRFYINKRFYENDPKVEPFLKDDEYIFCLKSSLPAYYLVGVIYNLLLIGLLYFLSFLCFKRFIFPIEKKEAFSNLDLKLEKGTHHLYDYDAKNTDFPDQVFNVLMGKAGKFTGKISIGGENIVTGEKKNFVYLPDPDAIPGKVKVKAVINLLAGLFKVPKSEKKKLTGEFEAIIKKPFEKIEEIDKVNIMHRFAKLKKPDIYLLQNFLSNIKQRKTISDIIEGMKDAVIIEISSSFYVPHTKFDDMSLIRLEDSGKYEETLISEI